MADELGRRRQRHDDQLADRLAERGYHPVDEATFPHEPCTLRLGAGKYVTGFGTNDRVWLDEHDLVPVYPTHFQDHPD